MKITIKLLAIAIIFWTMACEKEEQTYIVEDTIEATALRARVQNCSFQPATVTTVTGSRLGYQDGQLDEALFNYPNDIVFDENRKIMYVIDRGNHRIRAVSENKVTTFIGGERGDKEGVGRAARLNLPTGITIDKIGNLYVADYGNHKIRKITPEGRMTTLAGGKRGYADGRGSEAMFFGPHGITIDYDGILYVTDAINHKIRYVKPNGYTGTLAGSSLGYRDSNNPSVVRFAFPRGIEIGSDGALYVADFSNYRVRRIDKRTGNTRTFAGSGYGDDDGPQREAKFSSPSDIVFDKAGNLFVADGHKIRVIIDNQVYTMSGFEQGFEDGNFDLALYGQLPRISIYQDDLYVADMLNHAIRKIDLRYRCNR